MKTGALLWLLGFALAWAQPDLRWRWSNPRPFGNNATDLAYAGGLYLVVGERGQLYSSYDLDTWTPQDSFTTNSLRGVAFLGGRAIIVGENGTVLYGDTPESFSVTNLGTANWLEAVACNSTNLAVAVGDNAAVYTSTNGILWQLRSQPFSTWLRGVAYGAGGFVAVGEGGFIATSSNGTSWQQRTSGTTSNLNRVVWIVDRYWATGDGGKALTSGTGVTWTQESSGASRPLYLAAGDSVKKLVGGDTELRLKQNGVWSNQLSTTRISPAPAWTYLSSVWDGRLFLVGGRTGMLLEGFSNTNGTDTLWVDRNLSVRTWLWAVTRTTNLYVAVGDKGTVMTSFDGVDWQLEFVPSTVTNSVFIGVGGAPGLTIAAGSQGSLIISTNGFDWTAIEPRPSVNDLQGVAFTNGLFVVCGGAGTILTSTNGTQWTTRVSGTTNFLSGVLAYPGGFIAVGHRGTILTSPDAVTWTKRTSGITNWLYRIGWFGSTLVTVGQNGVILTSTDGASWTARTSGTSQWLNDVARLDGYYFAVGNGGAVVISSNLTSWSAIGTSTRKSLFGVATHQGRLVTVGTEGVILRTRVFPQLDPPVFQNYARTTNYNLYFLSGKTDQRITLDHSLRLTNWNSGPRFEFLDGGGTLLLLETRAMTNREFYEATLVP